MNNTNTIYSRRDFQRLLLAGVGMAAGSAVIGVPIEARETKFPVGRYIDMHTHLGQAWNGDPPLTAQGLLRWMDANRISQAIVLPVISPESSSYPITSNFVLTQTKPHRDRLIPFCSVDPRTSYRGGLKGLVKMLTTYKEAGAMGFGEHKPGVPIDDPGNMRIYQACAEVELPLLFHLDNKRNTDKPGLPGLERVLKEVPKCIMIGHGPGWWASISGDASQTDLGVYPRGKVAQGGAIDRLMEKYPNLYGDLSAGSGARAITRDMDFGRKFLIRRADRLMFGTDYLRPGQNVPQLELYGKIDLPEKVQAKVYRENARKLVGLG